MVSKNRRAQSEHERQLLQKAGYKWRKEIIPDGPGVPEWVLYDKSGKLVNKKEAIALVQQEEDFRDDMEAAEFDAHSIHWHGLFSEAVAYHPLLTTMHQEGDSYVWYPKGTRYEKDEATGIERYVLPDNSVLVMKDDMLSVEGGKGY
jgi:hypothetical protein